METDQEEDVLDGYIQRLTAEGDWASAGAFSLDPRKSVAKLAVECKNRPEAWLLFLLQALAEVGVPAVEITQTARMLALRCPLSERAAARLNLRSAHFLQQNGDDAGADLLRKAMLWAQATVHGRSGQLLVQHQQLALRVSNDLWHRQEQAQGSPELLMACSTDRRVRTELQWRCAFSPLVVGYNGETLSTGSVLSLLEGTHSLLYHRWVLGEGPCLSALAPDQLPAQRYALNGRLGFERLRRGVPAPTLPLCDLAGRLPEGGYVEELSSAGQVARWHEGDQAHSLALPFQLPVQGGRLPCRAVLARVRLKVSRLFLVERGICLNPVELTTQVPGWLAAVAAGNLRTDFSGLEAVADDLLAQLQVWCRDSVQDIHHQLGEQFQARRAELRR